MIALLIFCLLLHSHPIIFISITYIFTLPQQNDHPITSFTSSTSRTPTNTHHHVVLSLSTLLRVFAASAASIPFVAAQTPVTTEQLYGNLVSTAAPAPGFNAEGGSVFTNFVNAVNDGQFFLLATGSAVFERPESEPVSGAGLNWCSDLTFSDFSNSSLMGLAGRCVASRLAGYAEAVAAGAQVSDTFSEGEFTSTKGISAVFVEQLNIFQSQVHFNTDDGVYRWFDNGSKTMPYTGWEGQMKEIWHPTLPQALGLCLEKSLGRLLKR